MDNYVRLAYIDMMGSKLIYHRDARGYLRLDDDYYSFAYNGSWLDRYFI